MSKKIIVIGGGLAGALLCNELVNYFDVTLLEKGLKNDFQYPQIECHRKDLAEVPTFCYGKGGTTNLWHNGLMPINTSDITDANFLDVLTDAQSYIDQAASALFFTNQSFQSEYETLLSQLNALSELSVFPHGVDCLIYPKKFSRLNIDSRVNDIYDVQDIEFVFNGENIKAVNFSTGQQGKQSIDTDVVIVCAGAMGTPRILQKIMNAANLSTEHLGTGFIDHPCGFVGKVKFKQGLSETFKKFSWYDRGAYYSRNAIRLKSACGQYTACAYFRPALTMSNRLPIYKYKSALGAGSGLERLKKVFSWKLFHPDILAEIYSHVFSLPIPGRVFNILFVGEQKRDSNRIYYNGDGLKVDWSVSAEEIEIYRHMLRRLQEMLQNLTEETNIQTNINEDWLWSMAHHSGTVSMGDADEAFIDRDLRFKCCPNVFVCDGSVIQEQSYANTGLTIAQLALRLADKIREEVNAR